MAEFLKQVRINLDLGKNQIKNLVIDKEAAAPSSPVVGQIYFDTGLEKYGVYLGSGEGKGWKYFATTAELEAGLSEKQNNLTFESDSPLSLDGEKNNLLKIAKSTDIAAAGLASDSKVATEKAVRNLHNGIPAEAMTLTNKTFDAKGTGNSLSNVTAANFDANGLAFGTDDPQANAVLPTLKKVEAMVTAATPDATESVAGKALLATQADVLAGTDDTKIVTPAKLHYAIEQNIKGAVTYKGAFDTQAALEAFKPIHVGDLFVSSASAPITIGSKTINAGDWVIFRSAVDKSTTLTGDEFDVIDATDETDIVRVDATQTLTHKTIDADDNTISDLTVANLKQGVLVTDLSNAQSDDSTIASAKAVQTAINTASPHVDGVTIEAYKAQGGDAYDTLRVRDGGLTVEKFNASDLSLATSEQQADAVLPSQAKVTQDITAERTATATLQNKTIDLATGDGAGKNVITNAQVGIFAQDVVRTTVRVAGTADDNSLATEAAVRAAVNNVASDKMTLTNKTFDANGTGNSLSNVEVADFAADVVVKSETGISSVDLASDSKLVSEKAVSAALNGLDNNALSIKSVGLTFDAGTGQNEGTASCTVTLSGAGFKEDHTVSSAKVIDGSGNEVECLISYITLDSAPAILFQINGAAPSGWKAIIVA